MSTDACSHTTCETNVEPNDSMKTMKSYLITFDQVNEAHALYETKRHTGKIVLTRTST